MFAWWQQQYFIFVETSGINVFFQAFDLYASSDLISTDDDSGLRIESFEE